MFVVAAFSGKVVSVSVVRLGVDLVLSCGLGSPMLPLFLGLCACNVFCIIFASVQGFFG